MLFHKRPEWNWSCVPETDRIFEKTVIGELQKYSNLAGSYLRVSRSSKCIAESDWPLQSNLTGQ